MAEGVEPERPREGVDVRRSGGKAAGSLEEALRDLPEPRLIAGSLYLAGDALRLNGQLPD